jgi:hypothetical protein
MYDDKDKKYLSELTDFLDETEWLKVSHGKYKSFSFDRKYLDDSKMIGMKPENVSWFSKGSWLFHDMCCNLDSDIIYVKVDYSNVYRIANSSPYSDLKTDEQYKKQLTKFNKKYIISKPKLKLVHKDNIFAGCEFIEKEYCEKVDTEKKTKKKPQCKWNTKRKKCDYIPCSKKSGNCQTLYRIPSYRWDKLLKKYDGFAIYPIMTIEDMKKLQQHYGFMGWDVETLILLNDKPITKHYNMGTLRELLNIPKNKEHQINYSKLVSALIKKITEIREK